MSGNEDHRRQGRRFAAGGNGHDGRNLKMSGNEDHHRQGRRFAAGGNGHDGRDPRNVEIERLRQQVRDLEIQHEIRQIRKRIRELELQRELTKKTKSEPIIWDIGDEEEEYPFVNKYPSLQEPSMLVEEESCPVYDTDNEEESEVIYDTYGNDVDDSPKFELLHTDQGDSLVIQWVLSMSPSKSIDDDSWRRNNIFRTKYNSKDKVCNMINDGGSCKNAVSTYLVKKLALKTVGHPEPYQFTWLKKRNAIKVNKRCLVEFSARRKYKDKVWCEVIPMDACHILLGFKKIKIREGEDYTDVPDGSSPVDQRAIDENEAGNFKMSGNEDHHRQGRRFTAGGNGHDGRDPRDVEIERLRDEEEEYPFVNKYPSLQEPSMLVEEESCPVYDTDNEEESEVIYDTYGNNVDDSPKFELLHTDQGD
nr:reverse transcriptase domain-containing protein [Tanacetum cinerariifolium]